MEKKDMLYINEKYNSKDWMNISQDEINRMELMTDETNMPYLLAYDKKIEGVINRNVENMKLNANLNNQEVICIYKIINTDGISGDITIKCLKIKK